MSAQSSPPTEHPASPAPVQGAELQGQVIRIAVFFMLVLSAFTVFIFNLAWRHGDAPPWAPLLAPGLFTAFVVAFTVDRWFLVRRRRYPFSRALFQVAAALVFLTLLLPQQTSEPRKAVYVAPTSQQGAMWLLGHTDAKVRASTCEVLRGHYPTDVTERVTQLAHSDTDNEVRTTCELALERLHADTH